MIIGAQSSDFSDIVAKSPNSFGVFYWWSEHWPAASNYATITKEAEGFVYEVHTDSAPVERLLLRTKAELVERMKYDNLRFNGDGKCTIEF